MKTFPPYPCPKCNRNLKPSGEATLDFNGHQTVFPVYQCDECLQVVDFCGEKMEQALTFTVDETGRVFDPTEPDGELKF